jgi:hypothetical protein
VAHLCKHTHYEALLFNLVELNRFIVGQNLSCTIVRTVLKLRISAASTYQSKLASEARYPIPSPHSCA